MDDQTKLQILREGESTTKLGVYCIDEFALSRNENEYWKEILTRTSVRMIFSLYPEVTLHILTTGFYVYVMVWWRYGTTRQR